MELPATAPAPSAPAPAPADEPEPQDNEGPPWEGAASAPEFFADRVYGAVLGGALGDALGLQVEGDDAATVADRHPGGPDYPYRGAYRGHPTNDVTDATDFTALVLRVLAAYFGSRTEEPAADFAARVQRWHREGFPELGDTAGLDAEGVVLRAMAQPGFARDPVAAARAVKGPKADNGALIRTAPCAFTAAPAGWALVFCEATHADERCAAATRMLALLVHRLACVPADAPIPADLVVAPVAAGRALLRTADRRADYMRRLTASARLAQLDLGSREHRSYVLKTLAVGMWAFRQLALTPPDQRGPEFFQRTVRAVAAQGGDASANCMTAGLVLGAALGHKKLPTAWLNALPVRGWLEQQIADFVVAATPTWGGAY